LIVAGLIASWAQSQNAPFGGDAIHADIEFVAVEAAGQ
jgi:hypothetical protein